MKKTILFAAAVLALAACSKESPVKEEGAIDASKIVFDIKVENADGDATKAVKTAWESGDVVYAFFEDNTTQYVKMTYNGTSWTYKDKDGGATFTDLTLAESGKKVSAVYFPGFVCSAAPTWRSGKWTFGTVSGYFQTAVSGYTVTSTGDVTTLSANLTLKAPADIMQVCIDADAPAGDNEYVLTGTHFIPFNFNGIVPGSEDAPYGTTTNGFPMTGYKGTMVKDQEESYYFWGILDSKTNGSTDYAFQLVERNADKKYAISSKSKTVTTDFTGSALVQIPVVGRAAVKRIRGRKAIAHEQPFVQKIIFKLRHNYPSTFRAYAHYMCI